jgi:hypothetical protein
MKALARLGIFMTICGLCWGAAYAQTPAPPYGSGRTGYPNSGYPNSTANRNSKEPCWKQVGISQGVNQERKQIEESTRSQVESVCHNSSMSVQQKQQEIRQLREQARQRIEGLVGAQQEQALRACRERNGEGGRGGRGGHGGGENVCEELGSGLPTGGVGTGQIPHP